MRRASWMVVSLCVVLAVIAISSGGGAAGESGPQQTPLAGGNNRFGLAQPRPGAQGSIRVAAYNVLNLFDHVDDPKLQGEHDDIDMATSDDRCRNLAAAIRAADADILALEEVESLECLTWFRDTYLKGMRYEHLASFDAGYYRGVEQSVMSRFPITNAEVWPNLSLDDVRRNGPGFSPVPNQYRRGLTMQRSPLRVDVKVDEDYELTLFIVHHKSGRDFRFQREAEALRTIELVDQVRRQDPSRNIIVLGDFNAAPWDKSFRLYLEAGLIDVMAHRIIPRWKEADETEPNLYKTHESDRVLDYILLSSAAHREFVIGSAQVLGTLYDPDYDWRTDPYPKGYASDHYPVMIDLIPRDIR
jgi:endonuclease/exonuclease/phosphatase family metal-dependent hydrolase